MWSRTATPLQASKPMLSQFQRHFYNARALEKLSRQLSLKMMPTSADSDAKGVAAERAAEKTMTLAGFEILDSSLAGNRGFDSVGVKYDAQGDIEQILIVESKYNKNGKFVLAKNPKSTLR